MVCVIRYKTIIHTGVLNILSTLNFCIIWLYLLPKEYANSIADRHFRTALMKKVWAAWRSASEVRWKDKVARACQLRAEDVCVQLTNDYEAKIAEVKSFFFSFFCSFTPNPCPSKVSLSQKT